MPQLPDPYAAALTAPQPTTAVADVGTSPVGAAIAHFGQDVAQMGAIQQQHLDDTYGQAAVNKLQQKALDLQMNPGGVQPDGSTSVPGFQTLKGGDAVGANGQPPILTTYPKLLDDASEEYSADLSPGAQAIFNHAASNLKMNFQADVLRHSMGQMEVFQDNTDTQKIGQYGAAAAQNAITNPDAAAAYLDSARSSAISMMARKGVANSDMDGAIAPVMSNLYSGIVQAYVDGHNLPAANLFLSMHKNEMTEPAYNQTQAMLSRTGDQLTAQQTADQSFATVTAGKPANFQVGREDVLNAANATGITDPVIRQQLETRVDALVGARTQQITANRDNTMQSVQQKLIQNKGNMGALSASDQASILANAPGDYDKLQTFAAALQPGAAPTVTDPWAYSQALAHPELLAQMSKPDFDYFTTTQIGAAQRPHIAQLRADALSGKVGNTQDSFDHSTFNSAVNARLTSLQIDPNVTPAKDKAGAAAVSDLKTYLANDIFTQQQQLGRKMTPQEVTQRLDKQFSQTDTIPHFFGSATQAPVLGIMRSGDIPPDELQQVKDAWVNRGVANPTESQLMTRYRAGKLNAQ